MFYSFIKDFFDGFFDVDWEFLKVVFGSMISDKIIFVYKSFYDFMSIEYLVVGWISSGILDIFNGKEYYKY